MGNRDHLAIAGAVALKPSPEPLGSVVELDRAQDRVGQAAAAEDHVTVQHADSLESCCSFETCEGREQARLVELVGVALDLLPDAVRAFEALVAAAGGNIATDLGVVTGRG